MNAQKRTYLQMQLEEASLDSGRYNTDFVQKKPVGPASLLNAFRSTAARLGTEFNLPTAGKLGVAELQSSSKD